MALASYAWGYDGGTYNGKDMRQLVEAMFPVPGSGVVTGLAVTQQASPTSTVQVSAGKAIVQATGSGLTGTYHAWNDAALTSPTIDPTTTNGRKDRLIIRVSSGVPALEVVKGTAAASPAEPAITGDNYLELALITLPSSTSNITNAMITDRRVWASALRAPVIATSSTRPASPVEGEQIVETDTDRTLIYSGSAWVRSGNYSSTGRTGFAIRRNANQSVASGVAAAISWDTEDFDSDAFFAPTSTTVTIPTGLGGLYAITFSIETGFPTNGSSAKISIVAGGITHAKGWASYDARGSMSVTVPLAAADTITANVLQSVGGTANFNGRLWGYRLAI